MVVFRPAAFADAPCVDPGWASQLAAPEILPLEILSIPVEKACLRGVSRCATVFLPATSDYRTHSKSSCTTSRAWSCSGAHSPQHLRCPKGIALVNANQYSPN